MRISLTCYANKLTKNYGPNEALWVRLRGETVEIIEKRRFSSYSAQFPHVFSARAHSISSANRDARFSVRPIRAGHFDDLTRKITDQPDAPPTVPKSQSNIACIFAYARLGPAGNFAVSHVLGDRAGLKPK